MTFHSFPLRSLISAITVALAITISFASLSSHASDYLPSDLRARVDQLKSDYGHIQTTTTNVQARAGLLYEWINAHALNDGYVPVDATLIVRSVLNNPHNPALITQLNNVIEEFILLDDQPNAIGQLNADLGPHPVATFVTIKQTYTVGELPVQTGGGFMVARHFIANFGNWQTQDPSADNFISITSSNPRVTFVTTTSPVRGMHGGFRAPSPNLVFEVASGTLQPNDTVTITYGDTSQGSKGLLTPTFSSDRMPLPLYVAFQEDGLFFSLPIQHIKIIGDTTHSVAGFVPSIVKAGENFEISIRAEDRYRNRAVSDFPHWKLSLNGQPWQDIAATSAITVQTTKIDAPGIYYITINNEDGSITGVANPMLVIAADDDSRARIFWGDTHGHSGFAEGVGTPDRFMQWAKEDARLDYVTHSEHDIWLDDAEWEVLRENVNKYSEEGKFIAYLGYEWTSANTLGGHHNVLFRTPAGRARIGAPFTTRLSDLYTQLRNTTNPKDVVVIPHAHQAGDYRTSDPQLEPLIEIMSQHGNFEWFGKMYLQHGHQVGFTAASDNHISQPGYSAPLGGSLSQQGGLGALLAPARTTDDLFDAMKNLQAYATSGERMILDFNVNDVGMGNRIPFDKNRTIKGQVIGTAPIDHIEVIKNGKTLWQKSYVDNSSRVNREATFLLTFDSDSTPFHRGDNPRGWRTWEGTLNVLNANIESITPWDASFPQTIQPSKDDPNTVIFSTKTRGDTSSFLVKLTDIQRTARIQFDLIEALELGGGPPIYRKPQRVPALSFALALRDMEQGKLQQTQVFDGYKDTVSLRRIVEDGAMHTTFELTDTSDIHGDYYFVRVKQVNDAVAWSSPIWVGGHPPQ